MSGEQHTALNVFITGDLEPFGDRLAMHVDSVLTRYLELEQGSVSVELGEEAELVCLRVRMPTAAAQRLTEAYSKRDTGLEEAFGTIRIVEIGTSGLFPDTPKSLVLRATSSDPEVVRDAYAQMAALYWVPLFTVIRLDWSDVSDEDAEDLVQSFFASIIEKGRLGKADAMKGSLRTYLRRTLKNLNINEFRKRNADKRGGGAAHVSISALTTPPANKSSITDGAHDFSADERFDCEVGARCILLALREMRDGCRTPEQLEEFMICLPYLDYSERGYDGLAAELGKKSNAVTVQLGRLRAKLRAILRRIAEENLPPGATEKAVDAEIKHWISLLDSVGFSVSDLAGLVANSDGA